MFVNEETLSFFDEVARVMCYVEARQYQTRSVPFSRLNGVQRKKKLSLN